jgi:basic amino acid/polyamine antiporter, APA family
VSAETPAAGAPPVRLFTRRATGLVRDVSPLEQTVFAILTAPFPWVLAIAIFWTFSAYPGGNLYVGYGLGYLCGLFAAIAIGMLATTMPRSGGDYILNGRTIHPLVGLISSFWFTVNVLVSIAFITETLIVGALAPSFVAIGAIGHHKTLLDWGTTLESSKNWLFVAGIIGIILCCAVVGSGWKFSLRFQNWAFLLGMLGMAVAFVLLLVETGGSFVDHFNSFAQQYTHKADSYHYLINQATADGINVNPGTNWSNTIPVVGAVMGFSIYTWFGINIGGEVQQARTWKFSAGMIAAVFVNFLGVLIFTLLFVHSFGGKFFTAINSLNGGTHYPFPTPPFYVFLVAIAGNSEAVAWVLGISLVSVMLGLLWLNLLQPVRAMFAYAFDGVFPLKVAHIERRTHVPIVAVVLTLGFSIGLYAWAVYGSSLFKVYVVAIVLALVPMLLMSISAMILPWRRRQLWESSVMNIRLGPVPLITIAGVFSFAAALFCLVIFLHYPGLGLSHPWDAAKYLAIIGGAAIVVWFVASYVRSQQGMSLAKTTAEIPPE